MVATIKAQIPIENLFLATVDKLISIAVTKSISLSTSSGIETAVSPKVKMAAPAPTMAWVASIANPFAVRKISQEVLMFVSADTPRNKAKIMWAKKLQNRKIKANTTPIQGIWRLL